MDVPRIMEYGGRPGSGTSVFRRVRYGGVIRFLAATMVSLLVAGALSTQAVAAPPNPDPDRIEQERAEADRLASRVGKLANQLTVAESKLRELSARVELKMEAANKAIVDLRRARHAYEQANRTAEFAQARAQAAADDVDRQRRRVNEFAARSYQQGQWLGSVPAYFSAKNPEQVLERAVLLDAIQESQLDVLDELRHARIKHANKQSMARQAVRDAAQKRQAAKAARKAAEAAKDAAIAARQAQQSRAQQLMREKARLESNLAEARADVAGLEAQRERYLQWKARRQQARPSTSTAPPADSSSSKAVEIVIERALSQVGVPYAWGGGNANGPTKGIRDGGVADAHGDYKKIGFDCSGLMVYAFAGVGIDLPHYSGYQYQAGRHVPVSQARRGDMLFWDDGGRIHHVALYLGDGMMVEAPYSGGYVRVTPVRYAGMAPYAVRLL